ncbi:MAG: hypothetical protein M3443_10300 [Actinomycetota bacterium]|nr:hypothetical protein [Actinomycetota bacterium]
MTEGDQRAAIADGDVLDGHIPPADDPARGSRTRFTRKRDYAILLSIVVALAVTGVVAWQTSEIRATESRTDDAAYPIPQGPEIFPPSLGEAWRADSPATWQPVAIGPTVVTGAGGTVSGRDPRTGDVRWTYGRDLPLCAVSGAWMKAVALYRTSDNLLPDRDSRASGGCSEMTSLKAASGRRDGQRNSDAELGTRMVTDGSYLTTTGSRLLTTVRSDLVRTMDFGTLPALVNPDRQPRVNCEFNSVVMTPGKVGVIERCPEDTSDRLTIYKSTAEEGKDQDRPVVVASVVLGSEYARIVAIQDNLTAVAMPDPGRVVVFDQDGIQVGNYPVDLAPDDLRVDPEGKSPLTITATGAFYWFTGSRTVVLSTTELRPMWTIPDTIGPGTVFAGRALVPVVDGIAVINQANGDRVGTIPVQRDGHTGVVTMASIGTTVLEQRGTTLVALH